MPRFWILAVVALGLLSAASTTRITIVVKNEDHKPVAGASVIVKFQGRSVKKLGFPTKTAWELQTNQEGTISIPPIPQGKILVQVIAKNYQTVGQTFDVSDEEKTLEITVQRPQKQYTAH